MENNEENIKEKKKENMNQEVKQDFKGESKLLVKDKDIVVPGQILAEGFDFLPSYGTYRKEDKIIANKLGLITMEGKVIKTIPMAGSYLPKRNDVIVGKVIDITMTSWRLNINSPYTAMLNSKDSGNGRGYNSYPRKGSLSKTYKMGDYIFCKVTGVSDMNLVDVTTQGPGLRKLYAGRIVHVNTHKVPRIIGKKGSMVNMIKQATDCKMIVGQNGVVWLQCDPKIEHIAVEAIKKIESESHIPGLTNKIKTFLETKTGKKLEESTREEKSDMNNGEVPKNDL
jgi:exosome complex component RRP4